MYVIKEALSGWCESSFHASRIGNILPCQCGGDKAETDSGKKCVWLTVV